VNTLYDEIKSRIDFRALAAESLQTVNDGGQLKALCPFHDERTPSFTIYADGYKCFGCGAHGDAVDWMEKYKRLSHIEAVQDLSARCGLAASQPTRQQQPNGAPSGKVGNASEVWARSIEDTGYVRAYMESRGLTAACAGGCLRLVPDLAYYHNGQAGAYPTMIAPAVTEMPPPGEPLHPTAVHRTYLQPDGAGKAPVEVARKVVGKIGGAFIPLSDPRGGDVLCLAEGIEDALAVMQATGAPAWAVVSANNMAKVIAAIPECVTRLHIFADADAPGRKAADETEHAWRQARGHSAQCVVIYPPHGVNDANDAYRIDNGATLRQCLQDAKRAADEAADASRSVLNAADWLGDSRTLAMPTPLIRNFLDAGSKMMIAGASKSRKSFFALELAMHLAAGAEDYLGLEICGPRRVLLLQPEIDAAHYQKRCRSAMFSNFGLQTNPVEVFGDRLAIKNCRGLDSHQLLADGTFEALAVEHSADFILFDPLYKLLATGREDHEDFREFTQHLDRITEATGAAIAYVHHYAKGMAGDRAAKDRSAGSGLLMRDVDASIGLTEHKEDGLLVLDAISRNYKPREPVSIKWSDIAHRFELSEVIPAAKESGRGRTPKPRPTIAEAKSVFVGQGPITKTDCVDLLRDRTGTSQKVAREIVEQLIGSASLHPLPDQPKLLGFQSTPEPNENTQNKSCGN
jgi:DNA primase